MLGITIAVFRESSDFQDALRASGCADLLVVAGGEFRARLTRVALQDVTLAHAEENVDRLASITVPPGLVRILLPPHRGRLVCSGMLVDAGCLITQAPGKTDWKGWSAHATGATSSCRSVSWSAMVVPLSAGPLRFPQTSGYGTRLSDRLRELIRLHAAVMRIAETHPGRTMGRETARGLEQEVPSQKWLKLRVV